jgi:SNF2 family DNA or RNA helicase
MYRTPGGTPYELDEEGYVKVKFFNAKGELLESKEVTDVYKKLYSQDEFSIDPKLIALAENGKLTKQKLLNMDYTDILRLGMYPKAVEIIKKHLGLRGVPIKNGFTIKPHQVKALTWMKEREEMDSSKVRGLKGGILSLLMGLGKTLITLIHSLSSPKGTAPTLVVASKTVMGGWKTDGIEKFFGPEIKVLYLHKDYLGKALDTITWKQVLKYDIVITTYDACISACRVGKYDEECFEMGDEHTLMKGKILSVHNRTFAQANGVKDKLRGLGCIYGPYHRVVCDESQKYANPTSKTYKSVMALYGNYKWCLSGTPIRNYDTDIWSQLRFCGYNGCSQTIEWKRKGLKYFKEHNLIDATFTMNYQDAGVELPPKTEYTTVVTLKGKQKEVYDYVLGVAREKYDLMMKNLVSFSCILAIFTRLRQCAIAPYLITAESKREKLKGKDAKGDKEAIELLRNIKTEGLGSWCHDKSGEAGIYSSKISEIINKFRKMPKGEKVLVFSMFTSCLDLLADAVDERLPNFSYVQIDGDTKGNDRTDLLHQFRTDPSVRAAFLTYKVGSEGLNLTEAVHCICIEPWWTDAVHNQAKARCWRIGQTKEVSIHNILVKDSLEERIIDICREKSEMAASYLDGTEKPLGKGTGKLDKYTLGRILGIR